jgi:hypothetical protein
MGDWESMTALQASRLNDTLEENVRLAEKVSGLEADKQDLVNTIRRLERQVRDLKDLDSNSDERDRDYCAQIRSLASQVEILKEIIKESIDR